MNAQEMLDRWKEQRRTLDASANFAERVMEQVREIDRRPGHAAQIAHRVLAWVGTHPSAQAAAILLGKGGQLGALLYARDHLLEAFIVPSASMQPTIDVGDRVLGNKAAYSSTDPRRGDIILFRAPEDWRRNRIERIVAVAGDTVEMKDGRLTVNGKEIDRPVREGVSGVPASRSTQFRDNGQGVERTIISPPANEAAIKDFKTMTVPKHHCFVLGDNRATSRDSRAFGPVPLAGIIARAHCTYWPAMGWARFGRIGDRATADMERASAASVDAVR